MNERFLLIVFFIFLFRVNLVVIEVYKLGLLVLNYIYKFCMV